MLQVISLPYVHDLLQRIVAGPQFRHGKGCWDAKWGHEDVCLLRLVFRKLLEERKCKACISFGQLPHSRVSGPRDLLRRLGWFFVIVRDVGITVYAHWIQGQIFGLQAADVKGCMNCADGEDPENSYTHHPLHSRLRTNENEWEMLVYTCKCEGIIDQNPLNPCLIIDIVILQVESSDFQHL